MDEKKKDAWEMRYDFTFEGRTTNWVPRVGEEVPYSPFDGDEAAFQKRDTPLGAFAAKVDLAKEEFKVGNLPSCHIISCLVPLYTSVMSIYMSDSCF